MRDATAVAGMRDYPIRRFIDGKGGLPAMSDKDHLELVSEFEALQAEIDATKWEHDNNDCRSCEANGWPEYHKADDERTGVYDVRFALGGVLDARPHWPRDMGCGYV